MDSSSLTLIDSLILGVVQGLTEFLPVSSDGHLAVAEILLGYHKESLLFDVMLHFGTLLAIFVAFRKETIELFVRTWALLINFLKRPNISSIVHSSQGDREIYYIWLITFVTGLGGILLEKLIEENSSNLRVAGIGFLVTSLFLWMAIFTRKGEKMPGDLTWLFPLLFGLAQTSALFTGISRSGMTIATSLLLGIQREKAGRFSFVAAIPIITLAVLYEARKLGSESFSQIGIMSVGVVASFFVGLIALKLLMLILRGFTLIPFAIYTLALGLFCL